jgi:hypothetical protein
VKAVGTYKLMPAPVTARQCGLTAAITAADPSTLGAHSNTFCAAQLSAPDALRPPN